MKLFTKQTVGENVQQIILDTCALIDGRIIEIVKSGFVPGKLIVPQFVIAELQFLADHGDSHKRERARYGLDVIRLLQDLPQARVIIIRDKFPNIKEVDDKLVAAARQYNSMLYTTDYNLNKVAQIEGVRVLNVNELAHALRPNHLPGERTEIKVTGVGQDKSQGVAYLEDGTMVVIEQAGRKIGQKVTVEFSRMLQTQAGKMMFAVLVGKDAGTSKPAPSPVENLQYKMNQQPQPLPPQPKQRLQPKPQQQIIQPKQRPINQQEIRKPIVRTRTPQPVTPRQPQQNRLSQPQATRPPQQPVQRQKRRNGFEKTEDALFDALNKL